MSACLLLPSAALPDAFTLRVESNQTLYEMAMDADDDAVTVRFPRFGGKTYVRIMGGIFNKEGDYKALRDCLIKLWEKIR